MKILNVVIALTFLALLMNSCKKEEVNTDLNDQDRAFMLQASMINTREIRAAKIAIRNTIDTLDTIVRPFALDLLPQDSTAQRDIIIMGTIVGNPVKDSLNTADLAQLRHLDTLSGHVFDSVYIVTRTLNYDQAIAIFNNEIANGRQPNVKAYANTHLTRVQTNKMRADSIRYNLYK